jgi:hypothetical protein
MLLQFRGDHWYWRGPAPCQFVTVRASTWRTSLWPENGLYLVPIKAPVRRAEQVDLGDTVELRLQVED